MGRALLAVVLATSSLTGTALAEPVLLISIDGLEPVDIFEAGKRGSKIPNLRRFIREGSYARKVVGVLPTVTYPSHATILTGTSPSQHGIIGNTSFDPKQINQSGWYWYAAAIRKPTLWDAAAKAGKSVANVHWPTSVGANTIRWNLPQYWRTGHEDDRVLMRTLATPGLVEALENETGQFYAQGIDESIAGDENRAAFAVALIARNKPDFSTVYLTALDHEKHKEGPNTPQARAILERIDAQVGKLVQTQLRARPDSVIAVVSDHGFASTKDEIGLFRPFIDAGLITLDKEGKVTQWDAMPWPSGGSIAIMLARPAEAALQTRVRNLLRQLQSQSVYKIASVAEREEIARMGGNPEASFYVNLAPGALAGGFKGLQSKAVGFSKYLGMHGYFPQAENMRAMFMLMGPPIPKARDLGEIDMRAIAPTLAQIMGVSMPDAEKPTVLP